MTGHWGYADDECGPAHWPTGEQQSPIDFELSSVVRKETNDGIKFVNYNHAIRGQIVNNGHSVQMIPELHSEQPEIYGGGLDQVYRLVQYHFHWGAHDHEGSEHTLGGLSYAAELHLVHQGTEDPDKLAVVGVFLKLGKDGSALKHEEEVLEKLSDPQATTKVEGIILNDKLPKNRHSFWRYNGSLTTPPCSECVTWTVFSEPIGVTKDQLELFRKVKDHESRPIARNFRPVQRVNKREVYHIVTK